MKKKMMKEKLKKIVLFFCNPRLIVCFLLAWLITNGWSYIMFAFGTLFEISWMAAIAGTYIAFLWLPISPEKIVTVAIAIALLRIIFPRDEKTLAVLSHMFDKAKTAIKGKKKKKDNSEQSFVANDEDSAK